MNVRDQMLVVWAVLGLATLACVVVSMVRPAWIATFNTTVRALVSPLALRVVVVLGWMWLGWHFFAR